MTTSGTVPNRSMSVKALFATAEEAAHLLGVERHTIARWIRSGRLSGEQIGRVLLIPRVEIENLAKNGSSAG